VAEVGQLPVPVLMTLMPAQPAAVMSPPMTRSWVKFADFTLKVYEASCVMLMA